MVWNAGIPRRLIMPYNVIQGDGLFLDRAPRGWHNKGMTTTMNHRDCDHPATKAARARCRKDRAIAAADRTARLTALRDSYYRGDADLEAIAGAVSMIDPLLAQGYYSNDLDAEEFIASLA